MIVSVIIPTYNRAAPVCEAIASVLAQTFDDLEVVVVDDGSTDDTEARVAQFRDPRLRYLRQPNAGAAAARNAGVAMARGDLLAFLDSDDLWKPDKLGHEVDLLDRHPEVAAVFSDLEKHDGALYVPSFMRATDEFSRRLTGRSYPDGIVLSRRAMYLHLLREAPVMPTAFTIRREAFGRIGGFVSGLEPVEDWEFFLRLARTERLAYVDQPLAVVRVSADSIHRAYSVKGRLTMAGLLAREGRTHAPDAEARAAIRSGIRRLHERLGWDYIDAGRRADAFRCYLRGWWSARDPMLLVRALALSLPQRVCDRLKPWLGMPTPAEPVS